MTENETAKKAQEEATRIQRMREPGSAVCGTCHLLVAPAVYSTHMMTEHGICTAELPNSDPARYGSATGVGYEWTPERLAKAQAERDAGYARFMEREKALAQKDKASSRTFTREEVITVLKAWRAGAPETETMVREYARLVTIFERIE